MLFNSNKLDFKFKERSRMCTSRPHDNLVRKHLHEVTDKLIPFLSLVLNISESIKCVLACLEPTPINKITERYIEGLLKRPLIQTVVWNIRSSLYQKHISSYVQVRDFCVCAYIQ